MAWVQVGTHKINTDLICYIDQTNDKLRVHFDGRWEGNPLELHFDEAKVLWKFLKAEDLMATKDKGSTAVLMPRAKMLELAATGREVACHYPLAGEPNPAAG